MNLSPRAAAAPPPDAEPASPVSRSGDRRTAVLCGLALAAAIAPFFALAAFAHPQNDDWVYAATALERGWAGANEFWYRAWSGRYTATAILTGTPFLGGVDEGVRLIVWANLLLLVAGALAAAFALLPPALGVARRAGVGLAFAALHLATLPSPAEGLYWIAGAATYQLSSAGLMLLAGVAAALERAAGWRRAALAALGALLAIGIAGGNEVSVACLDALAGSWLVWRSWRGRQVRWDLLAIAAAAAAGTVVAALAPGNQRRMELSGALDLAQALSLALAGAGRLWTRWALAGPLVPALALAMPALAEAARAGRWRLPHPAVAALAAAAATFGALLLPAAGARTLEPRAANVVHWVFLVGAFAVAASAAPWLERRWGRRLALSPRSAAALVAAALVLAGAFPTSLRQAAGDLLSGGAARYDAALVERYARIRACDAFVCEVPRIPAPPRSLFWFEDAIDEGRETPFFDRYKGAFASCFGKFRVRLSAPEERSSSQ